MELANELIARHTFPRQQRSGRSVILHDSSIWMHTEAYQCSYSMRRSLHVSLNCDHATCPQSQLSPPRLHTMSRLAIFVPKYRVEDMAAESVR